MKTIVYSQKGEEVGTVLLPKEVFEVRMNSDLVHQVVVSQMANQRRITAKTKDRAEVRGGGRKPWRQKGTGRARTGSIRSPIWRGGGVTFGPTTEKVVKKRIPKKIKRKALFMTLSAKAKENLIFVLDSLKIEKPPKESAKAGPTGQARPLRLASQGGQAKTKDMVKILNKLPCKLSSVLIALPQMDDNIIRAARNIQKVNIIQAKDLNVLDVLSYKYLVIPKEALKIIKDTFLKK